MAHQGEGEIWMNPYIILGALVSAIALFSGGFMAGKHYGTTTQKVADQAEFDKINNERTAQKAEANKLYRQAQSDIIALQAERDTLKTTLETERETNRKATDDLRTKYSGLSLRFRAQSARPGANSGSTACPGTGPASAAAAPVLQLPDSITSDLRQLALDADKLRDDYAECYGYAKKVR